MPVIEKLIVRDFRNIVFAELSFSPGINCICGKNGQGKTNLLDALHYLSLARSAFFCADSACFRHGTDAFAVSGLCRMEDALSARFTLSVTKGGPKLLKRDDKAYGRLSAHMGVLPSVMVSPQDSSLVCDSGEERRRFVNAVLSQMDASYLSALQKFNRCLAQRNSVLKESSPDPELLDVLDSTLAAEAETIIEGRSAFSSKLSAAVSSYYCALSGGSETVGVSYRPDCDAGTLEYRLKDSRKRDLLLKYTTVGVQRDDFDFSLDGNPIRKFGSQGQQKSFLAAMKLAQYDIMKERYGYTPILLLDDVFDKLDEDRMENMLRIVCGSAYGQIFITDTQRDRMKRVFGGLEADVRYFETENGEFQTCQD